MKVLLTGATGFVGVNTAILLGERGHEIIALHRSPIAEALRATLDQRTGGRVIFVQGDACDHDFVGHLFADHQPSHVVHAAAITPTAAMEHDEPWSILNANELSTLSVLVASAHCGIARLVCLSSAAVYDGAAKAARLQTDEDAPLQEDGGLYALTKQASERLCRWATARYGIDTRVVRPTNVFGPFERPTASRRTMSSVDIAVRLALAGTPLRCNGPQIIRDWIHAYDVAQAICLLLEASRLRHHAYNLTAEAVTTERLIAAVKLAAPTTRIVWVASPAEANVPARTDWTLPPVDASRLRDDTGFQPRFSVEEGVGDYAMWLRAQTEDRDGERG